MSQLNLAVGAVLASLVLSSNANAIVIRHDRPDSRYVELAKGVKVYADVVEAGGTLIAPQWVLTAAHVAVNVTPYTSYLAINGASYRIDRVVLHPEGSNPSRKDRKDLALLHLTKPVKGVEPVLLYRAHDETGQTVTFVGRGQTGDGQTGPIGEDGKMRGATNKVESANENYIVFKFDPPETATELEGISGPGDSGGPALLKVGGKWAIAGVSSANQGMGKGPCRYDTIEHYARVSTAVEWIESTMNAMPESTIKWTISSPFIEWPETRPGEIARALMIAMNSGDSDVYETFNQKYRDPRSLNRATAEDRARSYADTRQRVGQSLTVVEYATDAGGSMLALLRNEKGQFFQLNLYFYDQANTAFDGFWIGMAMPRVGDKGRAPSRPGARWRWRGIGG
jgi:hypothetical protein